jgi:hypothetical protein
MRKRGGSSSTLTGNNTVNVKFDGHPPPSLPPSAAGARLTSRAYRPRRNGGTSISSSET